MRFRQLVVVTLAFLLCIVFALSQPALAQDGGAVYKAKCAACHGPEGQGKVGPPFSKT